MQQLSLALLLDDECTFNNFLPGNNQALLDCLHEWLGNNQTGKEQFLFLWGTQGSGRSHLLQAVCYSALSKQLSHSYLNFRSQDSLTPKVLTNLEHIDIIALDDIDGVLSDPDWEEALFNCYNRVRDSASRLIVTANTPPHFLRCKLNDLRSRLSWGLTWQVTPLNDDEKIQALILHAKTRGLELSQGIAQFLLRNYPRNMSALIRLLGHIDQAALTQQRRLTMPFIKETLKNYPHLNNERS